jgi:uncharacterized membrane protein HdeD (DUF308 family)
MAEAVVGSRRPGHELMVAVLAKNWWAIGIRGVLGILFGLIALFLPGATMLSLVLVFAAYAFVDGVLGIVSAVRAAREGERWGYLVLENSRSGALIGALAGVPAGPAAAAIMAAGGAAIGNAADLIAADDLEFAERRRCSHQSKGHRVAAAW